MVDEWDADERRQARKGCLAQLYRLIIPIDHGIHVIEGLLALKRPCQVTLYLDSEYVRKGITEWIQGWKARGWRTAAKQPVKNADLWQQLDALTHDGVHHISWHWVKGHAGHVDNERADGLANRGVDSVLSDT